MKTLLPLGLMAVIAATGQTIEPAAVATQSKVTFKYDKFHDFTLIMVDSKIPLVLPTSIATPYTMDFLKPRLSAAMGCVGEHYSCTPVDKVLVSFALATKDWWFKGDTPVACLADGQRIPLNPVTWDGQVLGAQQLIETLKAFMPPETFLKLANSKSVECEIAQFEFRLSDENIANLREFASHMLPPPKPAKTVRNEKQ